MHIMTVGKVTVEAPVVVMNVTFVTPLTNKMQ